MYYFEWDDDEEDEYSPYGYPEETDGYFDDDYDDYVSDWEYQRSLMSPIARWREDLSFWFHRTRLWNKWYDYRHPTTDNGEIPF